MHINEPNGDAGTAAHLLTFDSVHGRWSEDVRRRRGRAHDRWGHASATATSPSPRASPWGDLGVEIVLECSGRFRTEESLDVLLHAGRAQGHRRRPRQGSRTEHRRRSQRPPLRPRDPRPDHGGVLHDELSGARRQGHPRGSRHPPRADHDAPRHDEHPGGRRRAAQGPAQGACLQPFADPHDHRVCDRDRPDLPRAAGEAERPGGARPDAERLAHRLRL